MPVSAESRQPRWRFDLALWLGAFAIRAAYLWQVSGSPVWEMLAGDGAVYHRWALEIAGGDWLGRGVFRQAPLYPYLLGALYAAAGPSLVAVKVLQALLGASACVLLARAGRRFLDPASGSAAGVVLALSPSAVFFDAIVQKSSLDIFLATLLLLCLARLEPGAPRVRWLAAGAVLGLLALTRENALFLAAVVGAWAFFAGERARRREAAARAAAFLAGLAAVLLPVGARNLAAGGEFHLTTSQFGPSFYVGNNPQADGGYRYFAPGRGEPDAEWRDIQELAERALGRRLGPREVSRYWTGRALDFVREDPTRWLRLTGRKLLLALNRVELADTDDQYSFADWSPILRLLTTTAHFGVLLPLAGAGIWLTRNAWRRLLLLHLLSLAYLAALVLFFVSSRYRLPLVPLLALFAGAGLTGAVRAVRDARWRELAAAGLIAAATATLANWPLAGERVVRARATMLTNIGAWAWNERRNAGWALDSYRRAIALGPQYFEPYRNAGAVLLETGRPAEGLDMLRRAAAIQPRSAEIHADTGRCLLALGRVPEAAAELQRAVAIDPNLAYARYWLGAALHRLGRIGEARPHFEAASRLRGSTPQ